MIPIHSQLKIPPGPRMALFRLIDAQIRHDPMVAAAFKTIRSWTGVPGDREVFAKGHAPALRLTPLAGPVAWWSTDQQKGTLDVRCELVAAGTCAEDLDGLWSLVERALYPADGNARRAFQQSLMAAGAHKGLVQLAQPALDATPGEDAVMHGVGMLGLEYRLNALS